MTTNGKLNLVYLVESDILQHSRLSKLSFRKDASYFAGRAGLIRIMNLILSVSGIICTSTGYNGGRIEDEITKRMMNATHFNGYRDSSMTIVSISLGCCTLLITLIFLLLLYLFMEVRCDLLWEKVNQKAHVICCVISVAAAFFDVLSIQEIQANNCRTARCIADTHNTRTTKFEEAFYPPYFLYHYTAFVSFLINAMLYSIASRIWLRNED